jgi:hypothetical protein
MIPPSGVSNAPLPDHIYVLPSNLASQPSLTQFWCQRCVVALTTESKAEPTRSFESFVVILQEGKQYCHRKNNFGVCTGCALANTSSCCEVSSSLSLLPALRLPDADLYRFLLISGAPSTCSTTSSTPPCASRRTPLWRSF